MCDVYDRILRQLVFQGNVVAMFKKRTKTSCNTQQLQRARKSVENVS